MQYPDELALVCVGAVLFCCHLLGHQSLSDLQDIARLRSSCHGGMKPSFTLLFFFVIFSEKGSPQAIGK